MSKIPKQKRKVTRRNLYPQHKKRLTAYAATYPNLCQLTEDDENGGLRFEIDKHRVIIRLTAPYSEDWKKQPVNLQKKTESITKSKHSRGRECLKSFMRLISKKQCFWVCRTFDRPIFIDY